MNSQLYSIDANLPIGIAKTPWWCLSPSGLLRHICVGGEVEGIGEDRGGVPVGKIKELERNSFLVGCNTNGREQHVYQSSIARTFGEAIVLEGGERHGWVRDWHRNRC
jgi:hypothetical protein